MKNNVDRLKLLKVDKDRLRLISGAGIAQLVVLGLAATVSRVRYSSGDISGRGDFSLGVNMGSNSIPPKLLRMRV